MTKAEFLIAGWIHYNQRLPVDDPERRKKVLVWNTFTGSPYILYSFVAREHYIKRINDPKWPSAEIKNIAVHHHFWMYLPGMPKAYQTGDFPPPQVAKMDSNPKPPSQDKLKNILQSKLW